MSTIKRRLMIDDEVKLDHDHMIGLPLFDGDEDRLLGIVLLHWGLSFEHTYIIRDTKKTRKTLYKTPDKKGLLDVVCVKTGKRHKLQHDYIMSCMETLEYFDSSLFEV